MTEELTWQELADILKDEKSERKEVQFERKGRPFRFVIRMLTQQEYDRAQRKITMTGKKGSGGAEIPLDTGDFKRELIRFGVVEGPTGFSAGNNAHVNALPVEVRDALADCIQEFTELEEVVQYSFRGSRVQGTEVPGADGNG